MFSDPVTLSGTLEAEPRARASKPGRSDPSLRYGQTRVWWRRLSVEVPATTVPVTESIAHRPDDSERNDE